MILVWLYADTEAKRGDKFVLLKPPSEYGLPKEFWDIPQLNQEEVIKALEKLLLKYPNQRICVIWDNVAFHKGQKTRGALSKGGKLERIHLINLPPYAPDMNPIEHIWNTVKRQLANIQFDSFAITKAKFVEKINGQKFAYRI